MARPSKMSVRPFSFADRCGGRFASLLAGLFFLAVSPAASAADGPKLVLELFTSQSCSSCPPAERVLADLDRRDDVVGIEWHVDYWDDLVAGLRGRWRDPFSDPAFTQRQREYNVRLRGTRAVYTPQMIVAGRSELPGFSKTKVRSLLRDSARGLDAYAGGIERLADGRYRLSLDGPADTDATLWQVTVLPAAKTDVQRGENKGKKLENHNVVRGLSSLGAWQGGAHSIDFAAETAGDGPTTCVILVQEPDMGRILFGLACPA